MNKIVSPKITALIFGVLTIVFLAAFYVIAWQEPAQAPPGGNVPTPINVGTDPQAKAGRISATEYYDYNDPSYYLNPSGNSNLGEMQVGSTFRIDSQGIPSWGGKTFTGYAEVEVRTGTGSSCRWGSLARTSCQKRCESYGETCVNAWHYCSRVCDSSGCMGPGSCADEFDGEELYCECSYATYDKIIAPTFK